MTLMGLIKSYKGLLIARFFLGVAEAGFFPAATYLLTIWYRRYEVQKRMAVFYTAACLSGAFSGLLAYGIEHMDGISGLGGWQWYVRGPSSDTHWSGLRIAAGSSSSKA
jgi:MFS family permease